ncbi:MAG TPA: DUF3822 family protein [Bacteroidales bacterium]|nr:DUF3822 family protein [Bacteroidales bacterium]
MQSNTKPHELFDETLDINATENYELAIQAGADGFSFCILDTLRSKMVMLRSFEPDESRYFNAGNIREYIMKDDFLTRHYKKIRLITPSPKTTLVPAELYDPGKKDEYFRFNYRQDADEIILSNKLANPDVFIVFAINKHLADVLNEFYTAIHPCVHLTPLFSNLSKHQKEPGRCYLHVHIEKDFFNLIQYTGGDLKLCNTFRYRNISDILYYTMNVFNRSGLDQEDTIHLSGQTEKFDELYSSFAMYVRKIQFSNPSGNFTFSYVFNDIELHRFINLFSIFNCA